MSESRGEPRRVILIRGSLRAKINVMYYYVYVLESFLGKPKSPIPRRQTGANGEIWTQGENKPPPLGGFRFIKENDPPALPACCLHAGETIGRRQR